MARKAKESETNWTRMKRHSPRVKGGVRSRASSSGKNSHERSTQSRKDTPEGERRRAADRVRVRTDFPCIPEIAKDGDRHGEIPWSKLGSKIGRRVGLP